MGIGQIGGIGGYGYPIYSPTQDRVNDPVEDFADVIDDVVDDLETVNEASTVYQPEMTGPDHPVIQPAESSNGSNSDSLRREHSESGNTLLELQGLAMGFSTRRRMELMLDV